MKIALLSSGTCVIVPLLKYPFFWATRQQPTYESTDVRKHRINNIYVHTKLSLTQRWENKPCWKQILSRWTRAGSSPVATGRLWWAKPPQTKLQVPPNWNMKHYKVVQFLSNLNVKPPVHEQKAPYWRLSGNGSGRIQKRAIGAMDPLTSLAGSTPTINGNNCVYQLP